MRRLRHGWVTTILVCLSSLVMLGGTTAAEERTYEDPFDYCAAVGTIDAPGSQYTGSPMPEVVIHKLKSALGMAADAPLSFLLYGSFWRCMEGEVYACTVGANIPCTTKADSSPEPAKPLQEFCRTQPNATVIPAVVTGRATIYDWRCSGGQPIIERQMWEIDEAGFLSDIWYRISRD